jgi:hypothetical protein
MMLLANYVVRVSTMVGVNYPLTPTDTVYKNLMYIIDKIAITFIVMNDRFIKVKLSKYCM